VGVESVGYRSSEIEIHGATELLIQLVLIY
jgi:hypothetical protein